MQKPGQGRARGGTASSPAAAAAGSSLQELQLITQRIIKVSVAEPLKQQTTVKIQAVAVTFRYESDGARDEDRLAVKALRDPGGFHGEQDANGVLCGLPTPEVLRRVVIALFAPARAAFADLSCEKIIFLVKKIRRISKRRERRAAKRVS